MALIGRHSHSHRILGAREQVRDGMDEKMTGGNRQNQQGQDSINRARKGRAKTRGGRSDRGKTVQGGHEPANGRERGGCWPGG